MTPGVEVGSIFAIALQEPDFKEGNFRDNDVSGRVGAARGFCERSRGADASRKRGRPKVADKFRRRRRGVARCWPGNGGGGAGGTRGIASGGG